MIVTGSVFPGTPLKEADLSERFGMSRTPVREALRMLRSEGLVQTVNNRGAQVAHVSRQEVVDAYEVRGWLESALAARAAEQVTSEQLDKLQRLVDATSEHPLTHQESVAAASADVEFHDIILKAAGNMVAADYARRARAITHRAAFFVAPIRYYRSKNEHTQIICALRRHSPRDAEAAMRHHLVAARLRITGAERSEG